MRYEFQAKMPEVADKIKFYISDVCELFGGKRMIRMLGRAGFTE